MAADDAARRSGPAPAGLNPSSRAWPSIRLLSVGFGSLSDFGAVLNDVRFTPMNGHR
jgi:hypothetical protein